MPRKAAVSHTEILSKLKHFSIFYPNGELKTETHPEWKEACTAFNGRINLKNLYLSVFQNRHGVRAKLEEKALKNKKIINSSKISSIDSDNLENETDFGPNEYHDSKSDQSDNSTNAEKFSPNATHSNIRVEKNINPNNFRPLNFTISLNEVDWLKMKPINNKLPAHSWTPKIARYIYNYVYEKNKTLNCPFAFKVGNVYTTLPDKYFDFYGRCTDERCQNYIYGVCRSKPENDKDGVEIYISTFDSDPINHKTKRRLIHEERAEAKSALKNIPAARYRNELADRFMNDSQIEPPDLPSAAVLRVVRSEAISEDVGLDAGPKDVISSIIYLMDRDSFIKQFCVVPFTAFYWLDNQIKLYNRLATLQIRSFTIDATGSLVKKLTVGEEEGSHIFLYQLLAVINNTYAPISQRISMKQDANSIKWWLTDFFKHVDCLPLEFVCDGSMALLNAISLSINKCTYKNYLDDCLLTLEKIENQNESNDDPVDRPFQCFTRLDRAHLIKSITKWDAFKKSIYPTIIQDFYVRIFALAIVMDNFIDLKKLIRGCIIMSLSQNMSEGSLAGYYYNFFIKRFAHELDEDELVTVKEEDISDGEDHKESVAGESEANKFIENTFKKNSAIGRFLDDIYKKAKEELKNEKLQKSLPNTFYCPDLKKNFYYTWSQFPAFTNVMNSCFNSENNVASSAISEAYFKDLKNLHGLCNPLNPNKFMLAHKKVIHAQVKLAMSEVKRCEKV